MPTTMPGRRNGRGLRTRTAAVTGLIALAATALIGSSNADASAGVVGGLGGHRSSVGTWSTAVTGPATAPQPVTVFEKQTLRQIVHVSIGGGALRVRLSN